MNWCHQIDLSESNLNSKLYIFTPKMHLIVQACTYIYQKFRFDTPAPP